MHFFDVRTAFFLIGILYLVMPMVAWIVMVRERNRPVHLWCLGGLAYGIGTILIALRETIPEWASYLLANALMMTGGMTRIQSLRTELGKPLRLLSIVLIVLFALGVFEYFRSVLHSQTLRLQWAHLMGAGCFLYLAKLAWQLSFQEFSVNARWIAAIYLLLTLAMLLRVAELRLNLTEPEIFFRSPGSLAVTVIATLSAVFGNFGYMGISLDRSMQRRVEMAAALARHDEHRRHEAKLSTILDSVEGYIYIKDLRLRYVYANRKVCDFFGKSMQEITGFDDSHFVNADTAFNIRINDLPVIEQGKRIEKEEIFTSLDGKISRLFYSIKIPLIDEQGKIYGLCGISTDITKLKKMEARLVESEFRYRTLADSGTALIRTHDARRLCEYVNEVWLNFSQRSADALYGDGWLQDLHPDDLNHCIAINESAFKNRQKTSLVYRLRRHDGEYRWIQDYGCPRYDLNGVFIGYIHYCQDITERKIFEENTQYTKNNLLEQIAQLDRQRSLGLMSASLGHELNQPLTAILTNAQVAKRGLQSGRIDTQQCNEFIDRIIKNTRRASQIIEKIRSFVRPDTVKKQPIDLLRVVQESKDMIDLEAKRQMVDIHIATAPCRMLIQGDSIQLSQVLLNLYRNAIEALQQVEKRAIVVELDQDGHQAHLRVRDSGPGFSEEALQKVGSPFFSTKADGLGMGLSISQNIIEQHNGHFDIKNAPEGGACFDIYLPLLAQHEEFAYDEQNKQR